MSKRATAALLALIPTIALLGATSGSDPAAAALPALPPLPHVVVVVMDRVTIDQLSEMPAVRDAPGGWTAGLVSTAGRGVVGPTTGALTFSAGARAVPPSGEELAFTVPPGPVDERLATVGTVGDAYVARTGEPLPENASPQMPPFVYPDVDLVARLNARPDIRARPGLLGTRLDEGHVERAVVTIREAPVRLAPLVAMDEDGVVPRGLLVPVGETADAVRRALAVAEFVAVDAGRVQTAGDVLRQVLDAVGPSDGLLVLSTDAPRFVTDRHAQLAPILVRAPGLVHPARLASESTRRAGLVSNVDLAVTVLDWFALGRGAGMPGAIVDWADGERPVDVAREDFSAYVRVADQRGPVFRVASALAIVALLAAAAGVAVARALLLAAAAVPLLMLVEPAVASPHLGVTLLVVIGGALVLGAVIGATVENTAVAFAMLAVPALAVLAVDVAIGSPLGARSLLGFTVGGGTRFYGLASEEMGVALGGLLLGAGLAADRLGPRGRGVAYAGGGLLVVLFAAPVFGAKFGMVLTAAPALAVAITLFERRRVSRRTALVAAGIAAAGAALAVIAGLALGARGSHVGTAARAIGAEGVSAAVEVLLRRAGVAGRLLVFTFWAWLVAAGAALWWFAAASRRARFRALAGARPGFRGAAIGLAIAAIAALLFNDAGAVVVATMVMAGGTWVAAELLLARDDDRGAEAALSPRASAREPA